MTVQEIQHRFPWIMKPAEWLIILVTPQRWSCPGPADAAAPQPGGIDTTLAGAVLARLFGLFSPLRSVILARSPALRAADWRLRQSFWALVWTSIVAFQRWPRRAPVPRDEPPIRLISAPESHPDFKAPSLVVPSDVPCAEKSMLTEVAVELVHLLQDIYPVVASRQPTASAEPAARLREVYTPLHRVVRKPPVWHPDLAEAAGQGNLLGKLAAGGPFAKLLERNAASGQYVIDLSYLNGYPVREGLALLGSRMHFNESGGGLKVSSIEYEGQTILPGESRWDLVERIALAGLVTHVTVWRQGMEYHVGGLAPVAVVTHNLPAAHPLRRLLAAHTAQTLLANHSTHLTLRRSGWDVRALSFPRQSLLRYYDDGARTFDIRRLDVLADARRRGVAEGLSYPYLPQALEYWGIIDSYVRAYLQHYYLDDEALQSDPAAAAWFEALDRYTANGIRSYAPSLTVEDLARLCTLIIYSLSVGHTENSLWNYAPFFPTTVRKDGAGQPIGEVQMTMDFQLLICSPTSLLMHDVSHLALDSEARQIMQRFQSELQALQRQMKLQPDAYWRLYPADVEASVSA